MASAMGKKGSGLAGTAVAPRRARPGQNSLAAIIHRWAGLTIGPLLAISGLTGSYLAFYPELETAAIAPLRNSPEMQPASFEAVHAALAAAVAPDGGRWNIELPPVGGVITARLSDGGAGPRMVSIDPATLEIVRDVRWGETVSTWIYELHYRLLMGRRGAPVMGMIGLAALALIFAGMILWWRSGRTARSRLRYQRNGTSERKLYDFHRLLGLASAGLLAVSVGTATAMSFPGQVQSLLTAFSPRNVMPDPQSGLPGERARLPLDRAIAIARNRLPGADIRWVQVPASETAPYVIRFWEQGEPSFRFPKSHLWLDQYDGRVLAIEHGPQGTATDRILGWLYPLHSGQAFGAAGRAVVALLGLVPTLLFVTGLIRWRRKSARLALARRRSGPTSF